MANNSFTITASIKAKLAKIDLLRTEILIIPASPRFQTKIRSNTNLAHIEGWINITNQPYSKEELKNILSKYQAKNDNPQVGKVLDYKKALGFVRENWTAAKEAPIFETVRELSDILDVNCGNRQTVEPILTYLNDEHIHPVIQAALAHLAFYPSRLSYLISLLYLARAGYDMNGWLSLEDCWAQNKDSYQSTIQKANESQSSTVWIDFFCQAMVVQMTHIKSLFEAKYSEKPTSSKLARRLNDRQMAILEYIEQSDQPVTNREVQSEFNITQITASRDLGKLSLLGVITSQGGGRSTSYTRA